MMLRSVRNKFDIAELTRRIKRFGLEGSGFLTYKKLFIVLLAICFVFYFLPPIFKYFFVNNVQAKDQLLQCMEDRLFPFFTSSLEYDAQIRHIPPQLGENIIPYVGNGYIGLEISDDAVLNIKSGRSMQLQTPLRPIVSLSPVLREDKRETFVTEYLTGIVHRFQCYPSFFVSYAYYAHKTNPSILMQEIKLTNLRSAMQEAELSSPKINFQDATSRKIKLGSGSAKEFEVTTGTFSRASHGVEVIVLSIVRPKILSLVQIKKRGTISIEYPNAIHYSRPVNAQQLAAAREETENKAIQAMTKYVQRLQSDPHLEGFRQDHINVWNNLWATGFSISNSKAERSLNGDRINATIYAVLSQSRSFEYEEIASATAPSKQEIAKALTYAEGCYDSYYTLQAENLWRNMDTLENMNSVVSSWMLTLEKQGCHNLIRAGASGIIQAMVLSFGSFRFSNQHLECNMHPKHLHRDFSFRRLNYGNRTHVNITITVTEDNKAVINVALDRSDRSYYACEAGCLHEPVLLTQTRRQFPVKLTEPLTAILYITEDKLHIEELRHAIHVKEVVEAPAHEQHVISLHRHGHQLGGLPTFFWVSICAIIVVFHVFLCKLIIKEYCEPSDKLRYHRYNKP